MARPRMNKCAECRKRKKRCDGQQPGCTRDQDGLQNADTNSATSTPGNTPPALMNALSPNSHPLNTESALQSHFSSISPHQNFSTEDSLNGSPASSQMAPLGDTILNSSTDIKPTGVISADSPSAQPLKPTTTPFSLASGTAPAASVGSKSPLNPSASSPEPKPHSTKLVHNTFKDILSKVKRSRTFSGSITIPRHPGHPGHPNASIPPFNPANYSRGLAQRSLCDLRTLQQHHMSGPSNPALANVMHMHSLNRVRSDSHTLNRHATMSGPTFDSLHYHGTVPAAGIDTYHDDFMMHSGPYGMHHSMASMGPSHHVHPYHHMPSSHVHAPCSCQHHYAPPATHHSHMQPLGHPHPHHLSMDSLHSMGGDPFVMQPLAHSLGLGGSMGRGLNMEPVDTFLSQAEMSCGFGMMPAISEPSLASMEIESFNPLSAPAMKMESLCASVDALGEGGVDLLSGLPYEGNLPSGKSLSWPEIDPSNENWATMLLDEAVEQSAAGDWTGLTNHLGSASATDMRAENAPVLTPLPNLLESGEA